MNTTRTSMVAAVCATGIMTAGVVALTSGPALAMVPDPSPPPGRSYVAPTSVDPSRVLYVGPFVADTRHITLAPGTPPPPSRRALVAGFGLNTPEGLIAKVESVTRLPDGRLDVTASRAALNEVLPPGDNHVVRDVQSAPTSTSLNAVNPKPFTVAVGCPGSTLRTARAEGSFSLSAKLDVNINTSFLAVNEVRTLFTYGDDLDLKLFLDGKLSCKASMPLATLKVPFMLGPVPMVASLDLTADATVAADGQLTLHGRHHILDSAGFDWKPGQPMQAIGSAIGSKDESAVIDDPTFTGTVGAQLGVTANVGLSVAEIVKGTVGVRGYIGADLNQTMTPAWSTYAGFQGKAGIWVIGVGEVKDWTLFDKRYPLSQAVGIPRQKLPTAVTGHPYSGQVNAVGGNAPYTLALASGSALPGGLTMSTSGAIIGTPTDQTSCHDVPFDVTVTDARGRTARQNLSITDCFYAPPTFAGASYTVDDSRPSLDVALTAQGDHPGFTWSSSALPPGYTLTSAGHLTASSITGSSAFPVTVTDSVGSSTTATVRVTFKEPKEPRCPPKLPWC